MHVVLKCRDCPIFPTLNIEINISDSPSVVLQKYAIERNALSRRNDSLPSYFYFDSLVAFTDESVVEVVSLLDKLDQLDQEGFIRVYKTLLSNFDVSPERLVILYLRAHDPFLLHNKSSGGAQELYIEDHIDMVRRVSLTLRDSAQVYKLYKNYRADVNSELDLIKKTLKGLSDIQMLLDIEPVPINNFNVNKVTYRYIMEVDEGTELEKIFDDMVVYNQLPFIMLIHGTKRLYKVYRKFVPPDSWINNNDFEIDPKYPTKHDGIYFKIFASSASKFRREILAPTEEKLKLLYTDGKWDAYNNITITFNSGEIKAPKMFRRMFSAMDHRRDYKYSEPIPDRICGVYIADTPDFNKALFADFVAHDIVAKKFLTLHEGEKGAVAKFQFRVYFLSETHYTARSTTIVATGHSSNNDRWVNLKITNAASMNVIANIRSILGVLFARYSSQIQSITDGYTSLLVGAALMIKKYSIKKTGGGVNLKSGDRLRALQKVHPLLFGSQSHYATTCSNRVQQPYIIKPEDVKAYINEYGEHKILKFKDPFSGDVDRYACDPRDIGSESLYTWPGIKENTKSSNDVVPCHVCCYKTDQLEKLTENPTQRYTETGQCSKENVGPESVMVGHPLASNKILNRGRYGVLPILLETIVEELGYKKVNISKKKVHPILRKGVIHSPDSFIHCMESAFNPVYKAMSNLEATNRVIDIREELATRSRTIARQELYAIDDTEIKDILTDSEEYIDPGTWTRLVSTYYNCNILIISVTTDNPGGDLITPHAYPAHLMYKLDEDLNTVIIIKQKVDTYYPFQCEYVAELSMDDMKNWSSNGVLPPGYPLVDKLINMYYRSVSNAYMHIKDDMVEYIECSIP